MKLKVCIWIIVLLCWEHWCWGQNAKTITEKVWVVNYQYSPAEHDTFEYLLKLPEKTGDLQEYNFVRIKWGVKLPDGSDELSPVYPYTDTPISFGKHVYPAGIYYLTINYYRDEPDPSTYAPGDKQVCHVIFNQDLAGNIVIEKGVNGCMERGVDTFLIRIHNHGENPPGTIYSVDVNTDAPGKIWTSFPPASQIKDSVLVIFTGPTGTFGADIRVKMVYKETSSRYSISNSTEARTVKVYKTPDLKEIFHFSDTLNPLETESNFKHFEVCTGNELTDIKYDSLANIKYAYADGLPMYYERYGFKVDYYRKDSLKQENWEKVSHLPEIVDTAQMIFKYPGYYKIRIIAENTCGLDSLVTDSIKNSALKRYIKVYQSGKNAIECRNRMICGIPESGAEVVFVDKGERFEWDPVPEYKMEIVPIGVNKPDTLKLIPATIVYKENKIVKTEDTEGKGCDSTLLVTMLNKLGIYEVKITRKSFCEPDLVYIDTIKIGDVPVLQDTLRKHLTLVTGKREPIRICGNFEYTLPVINIDTCFVSVDTISWYFTKKSHTDTLYQDVNVKQNYLFDSLGGHKNYICVKAHNYCGWSSQQQEVLFTDVIPDVKLFRDSLEKNDTLCLEGRYKYHWVGNMPEHYAVSGQWWLNGTEVNGNLTQPGDYKELASWERIPVGEVKYSQKTEKAFEYFRIWNTDNSECALDIKDSVVIIDYPETILYSDTIHYCKNLTQLNTKQLFGNEPPLFKYVEWKWNDGAIIRDAVDNYERSFTFNASLPDQLQIKTFNSKGCYLKKNIVLAPHELPVLKLFTKNKTVCADTLLSATAYTLPYIKDFNGNIDPEIIFKVYKDQVNPSGLIYDVSGDIGYEKDVILNHSANDTVRLIYEALNKKVTAGFGNCTLTDTIAIKLWKPLLQITGCDTIRSLNINQYELKKQDISYHIDTADVSSLEWSMVGNDGSFVNPHELNTIYSLGSADILKDSLVFLLSGTTPCGKSLMDSLIVYLPKAKLHAHMDTICENDPGYILWGGGKTMGQFVELSTLQWEFLPDKSGINPGNLTQITGTDVQYIPSSEAWKIDTVKIKVSAWNIYDVAHTQRTLSDTVFLKVNQAVRDIMPKIFYLKANDVAGRTISLNDLKAFENGATSLSEAHCSAVKWEWFGNGGSGASFSEPVLYIGEPYEGENYSANFTVTLKGQKGCADVQKQVEFLGVMPALPTLSNFEFCDGEKVRVDTGYRIKAKDAFLKLTWETPDGNGTFTSADGQIFYQCGIGDPVTRFKLKAVKSFMLYNGIREQYEESAIGQVHLYRKPVFHLEDGKGNEISHDTLCWNVDVYTYRKEWVKLENEHSANYNSGNLVIHNSIGLTGDFPDFRIEEGTETAKLIVTTDFGACKKWKNIGDTLYLTTLERMTGSFDLSGTSVCEGGRLAVTSVKPDPMCKTFFWSATGGKMDQTDLLSPVFVAGEKGKGTVTMSVVPPHGCTPVETFTKELEIEEKPALALRDTIICEGSDLIIPFVRHPGVQTIVWKANGRSFATTHSESEVLYQYNVADVIGGKISIWGEITPEMPCTDVVLSNVMTVALQKSPVVSGTLIAEVCQGDSLMLSSDIVTVANHTQTTWKILNGGIVKDKSEVNTRYYPGEISGPQYLELKVEGLNGCPDLIKQIQVDVKESELPVIQLPEVCCVGSELTITQKAALQPTGSVAQWYVDKQQAGNAWASFQKSFDVSGNYQVVLKTTYQNGCSRQTNALLTINALPLTDFSCDPDSIAGDGEEVCFVNTTPGTVTYDWDFHGQGTPVTEDGGSHIHRYDLNGVTFLLPKITLTVTDVNGCSASKTHGMKIIGKPEAKFAITHFDKCTGELELSNLSVGEDLTYYWDLGNGYSSVDKEPVKLTYPPLFTDSVYRISLKVSNKGGESMFEDQIKVVSRLDPKFIISPDKEGCEGKQLAKGFSNRSRGKADAYIYSWGDGSPEQLYTEFYSVPVYHTYSNPETEVKKFIIQLNAVNECHDTTFRDSIRIYPNIINTAFIPNKNRICFGNEITFTNESYGFGADAQAWWFFEPEKSPEMNVYDQVVHRFDIPGDYPVRLVMADQCNSDTSEIVNIRILGDRSLAFEVEEGPYCSGQKIEMKLLPEMKDKFADLVWDLGDGTQSVGLDSFTKQYIEAKDYKIVLSGHSVSEGNCPVKTPERLIEIHQTPEAVILPKDNLSGCNPCMISEFSRAGSGDEKIFWDFGNGQTAASAVVRNVVFEEPGEYNVLLRLTTDEGCTDMTNKMVRVQKSPDISFALSDSLFCTAEGHISVDLTNLTEQPGLYTYEWFYDDESFSRVEHPGVLELMDKFGTIQVTMQASDRLNGCSAEVSHQIISGHQVKLALESDTVICDGEVMALNSVTEYADKINWKLGDGTEENGASVEHIYDVPGQYEISIVADNAGGCSDSLKQTVSVYPLPFADFSYEEDHTVAGDLPVGIDVSKLPDIRNGGIRFFNHSGIDQYSFADGRLNSYWDFGDGSAKQWADNPDHRFENNGLYTVKLLVKTKYGCMDSVSQPISINAVKGLFIPNAFAPGAGIKENPGIALFQPKGVGLLSYRIKVYDDSGTCVWMSDKLEEGRPAEAWDGTFKGQLLPKKLYKWEVNAIFIDGSVWTGEDGYTQGVVLLIR